MRRTAVALLLCLAAGAAQAHKPSDSYLALAVDGAAVRGQWDIALRDLEYAIGLDSDGDGAITWGELKARRKEVEAYALSRLNVLSDGKPCALNAADFLVDEHSDGAYAVLRFDAQCAARAPATLEISYSLFFDLDPTHRGLLRFERGGATQTGVLSPERPRLVFRAGEASRLAQFLDYLREGVWHIGIGVDHILFILSLLLPSVLILRGKRWTAAERFGDVFWDVWRVQPVNATPSNLSYQMRRYAYGEDEAPVVFSGAEGRALGALEQRSVPQRYCTRSSEEDQGRGLSHFGFGRRDRADPTPTLPTGACA